MGRTLISREKPLPRTVRVVIEHRSTVSEFVEAPQVGDEVLKWMAPAFGVAGPFVFRVDSLTGETAQFQVELLTPAERSYKLYTGREGAGTVSAAVDVKPGDRVIVRLVSIAPRTPNEKVAVKGAWVSFTWTMKQEAKVEAENS